jgi:uncharacterized protein (DUF169 family)
MNSNTDTFDASNSPTETILQQEISRRSWLTHTAAGAAGAVGAGALGLVDSANAASPNEAALRGKDDKKLDLSIFKKFNFEHQPVGVKFCLTKPDGLKQLEGQAALCEMLKIAQGSAPFYATAENHECKAGAILLGMAEGDPIFESGSVGPKLGVYEDARANRRIYHDISRLERGSVNYVAFSSLDKLTFNPDLLIVTAKPSQAEIVLRAASYRTGAGWNAKGTIVLGCAWLYMYPYVKGQVNMMVTGLHHGMKARNLFPEGLLFLSLPFDILPSVVNSLQVMEWDLPQYHWGKETHLKRMKEIGGEIKAELSKK